MKQLCSTILILTFAASTYAADEPKTPGNEAILREPFTLKLHVDKESFYEEKFGKIPYVHNGDVYLFKDDEFGLNLEMEGEAIHTIKYQPDVKKADVTLKFTQKIEADGAAMMMLIIRNGTQRTLNIDALMTVPGKKAIARTSILPIGPGLSAYESWPHPIVQLVLRNIRIAK
jgi:hypothetical protein